MTFDLALVTGATSGIGKALLALLHEKKIETIALGSKDCDLSLNREPILKLIEEKKPDLIINCAGFGLYGDAIDQPLDKLKKMVAVNAEAVMEITVHGAKVLKEAHKKGVILNVSSLGGEFPMPGMAVYSASKAFVTKFTQSLDYELKSSNIRALVSCPGMVATNFGKRAGGKKMPQKGKMSAEFAAAQIWKQIKRGIGVMHFPPFLRFMPYCFAKGIIYRSIQKRL